MAHVLLLHSVLGLREAEHEIAAAFEADGHTVTLPDLYGGRTAEGYDEGFAILNDVTKELAEARAREALDAAPADTVLAGISMGAFMVTSNWDSKPGAKGAILLCGYAPFVARPPADLPISAHIARPDPFDSEEEIEEWAQGVSGVRLDLHRYEGAGHFFLDRRLPDYDADAAALCMDRCRSFLKEL